MKIKALAIGGALHNKWITPRMAIRCSYKLETAKVGGKWHGIYCHKTIRECEAKQLLERIVK